MLATVWAVYINGDLIPESCDNWNKMLVSKCSYQSKPDAQKVRFVVRK